MRVLVVDDDPFMLKLLARVVASGGYDVSTAVNGLDALQRVRDEGIPISVTDWQMPHMDGLDLCRALRSQEGIEFAHVILVTAQTISEDLLVAAFDAGVDDFLSKPVRSKELLARIRAGGRIVQLQQDLERRNLDAHRVNAQVAIASEQLEAANEKLRHAATTDELTGLTNRRAAMAQLDAAWARGTRHGEALSCIMLDIDHFKTFNDVYGHATGDLVLKEVARVLREQTRLADECCRFGGEEFLVICPGSVEGEASQAAERMRAAIESNVIVIGNLEKKVTVSVGVAQRLPTMAKVDDLICAADEALYTAKDSGRNLVVLSSEVGDVAEAPSVDEHVAAADGMDEQSLLTAPSRVMVVDDDESSRVLCRRFLEQAGYIVEEAANGVEVLAKVKELVPDVIVMDVMMPEMGGLECTRRLKDDPTTSRIPVVIASGRTDATDAAAAREAGAAEFIAKPLNATELVLRVASVARLKRELDLGSEVRGEQARAMAMLMDYTRQIAATESLPRILECTIDVFAELTSCRCVSIMLPDPAGEFLTIVDSRGIDELVSLTTKVPVGERIAGEVFATGKAIVVAGVDGRWDKSTIDSDFFARTPFVCKPLRAAEHIVGVVGLTDRCGSQPFNDVDLEFMDLLCNVAAAAIHACMTQQSRDRAHESIVVALATLAEYRDDDTGKHLDRVMQYCVTLAEELRSLGQHNAELDDKFIADLRRAVPLHDIGKVGVPDHVLLKPGRLTEEEIVIVRTHADIGANALQSVSDRSPGVSFLAMAEKIARSHHEWFDGSGYPRGMSGADIPLAARITAVADVYDALTTRRVYKDAMSHETAFEIIIEQSGTQFDPDIVHAFSLCQERFIELAEELRDPTSSMNAIPVIDRDVASNMQPRDQLARIP